MCFLEYFDEYKNKLHSIYDLASLCYDYILETISDEELFIGEYILSNEKAKNKNPNFDGLANFQSSIFDLLKKIVSGKEYDDMFEQEQYCLFEDLISDIYLKVETAIKDLSPYGEEEENRTTPVFCMLMAIDTYSKTTIRDVQGIMPLNKKYNAKSFVYKKVCSSIMDKAKEELKFSDCIRSRMSDGELQSGVTAN